MIQLMETVPADIAIKEAERCRLEAVAAVARDPDRYAALKDQPSGWCVVTQKGFWSRVYHDGYRQDQLRDLLDRGHKVLMTVGIVAKPDSPLDIDTHVAAVTVAEPQKLPEHKLQLITVRAKLHAARALFK
jgi:hypothetical protein